MENRLPQLILKRHGKPDEPIPDEPGSEPFVCAQGDVVLVSARINRVHGASHNEPQQKTRAMDPGFCVYLLW
jgi:hypothetical protein